MTVLVCGLSVAVQLCRFLLYALLLLLLRCKLLRCPLSSQAEYFPFKGNYEERL